MAPGKSDFSKWKKLKGTLKSSAVKVGVISGKGGADVQLLQIAAVHEFGSPKNKIPERSFIRGTFDNNLDATAQKIKELGEKYMEAAGKGRNIRRTLMELGEWGVNEVKKYITRTGKFVPLRPATIRRKGDDKPLVDSGRLLNSISYEIIGRDG